MLVRPTAQGIRFRQPSVAFLGEAASGRSLYYVGSPQLGDEHIRQPWLESLPGDQWSALGYLNFRDFLRDKDALPEFIFKNSSRQPEDAFQRITDGKSIPMPRIQQCVFLFRPAQPIHNQRRDTGRIVFDSAENGGRTIVVPVVIKVRSTSRDKVALAQNVLKFFVVD